MSRPYAEVIGDPISHSKSPLIHKFWLERLGIDADYRACHVRADQLEAYCTSRRSDPAWRGCNVTIPHKQNVTIFLDEIDGRANGVGAVNTILRTADSRLIGTNTDVDGVAEAVARSRLPDGICVVIGSGGAARAAFAFLARSDCGQVRVIARSPEKAANAVRECGLEAQIVPFAEAAGAISGASLLVNATQLGMQGQQAMPGDILDVLGTMSGDAVVFDMVYSPLDTELLEAARRLGFARSDGLVMLIGQAATAFERFFGEPAPRQCDDELRRMLVA